MLAITKIMNLNLREQFGSMSSEDALREEVCQNTILRHMYYCTRRGWYPRTGERVY